MPRERLLPLTQEQRIQQNRMRREGIGIATGVRLDSATEDWYRKQLLDFVNAINDDIEVSLIQELERKEFEYTRDSFISDFTVILNTLQARWDAVAEIQSPPLANRVVSSSDKTSKERLEKSIGSALGVNIAQLVQSEGLSTALEASVGANVSLIKSIPEQFLNQVRDIVLRETVKGRTSESIIEQIRNVHEVTENRARLIARDQSNKINGDLTRERQAASNIRAFRWRTVGDEAVRETHRKRNGLVYAWRPEFVGQRLADGTVLRDPNADGIGYPGEEIQCRCIAEPIIELERVSGTGLKIAA